jgi:hypothetical protein
MTTKEELAARLLALEGEVLGQLRAWLASSPAAGRVEKSSSLATLVFNLINDLSGLCREFAEALEQDQHTKKKKIIDPDLVALLPDVRAICWGLLALYPHSTELLDSLDSIVHYPTPGLASLGHLKQARAINATRQSMPDGSMRNPHRANRLVELALADKELPFGTLVEACQLYPSSSDDLKRDGSALPWTGQHLLALRRACLHFGPYAFMGPTLAVLVEYALVGLAWSLDVASIEDDDDDWLKECVNLLGVHLSVNDDEVRKRVSDSLPERIKSELQARDSCESLDLRSLLGSHGFDFKQFDEFMRACPPPS